MFKPKTSPAPDLIRQGFIRSYPLLSCQKPGSKPFSSDGITADKGGWFKTQKTLSRLPSCHLILKLAF